MADIHVTFLMQSGSSSVEIEVPEEMVVQDALEQLVRLEQLAPLEPGKVWVVSFKETGKLVALEKTMAENGITEGTALRIAETGVAGGGPTA